MNADKTLCPKLFKIIMRNKLPLITTAISCITLSLNAQVLRIPPPEDTTKAKDLEEVVITGQYKTPVS